MKTRILILSMVLSVMAISCSKDKNDDDNTTITAEEAGINSKIDIANDDSIDIITEQENNTYANTSGRTTDISSSVIAPCANVIRVPAFGTAVQVGQTVTKTIDFGTNGCTLPNGNVVKGIIVISFVYEPNATSHTVTYTFNNFYHNDIKFNGTKTFTRTMTTGAAPHPIVTMNMDLTATLADGRVFTRTGQRIREHIEGAGNTSWTDDVYSVTGSWTTTFPNTTVQTATITTPLIVKMSCVSQNKPLIVQGIITFVRGAHSATLNFGDGTCDNLAIFTKDGVSVQITIGR